MVNIITPKISMQVASRGPAEYAGSNFILCKKNGTADPNIVEKTIMQKRAAKIIIVSFIW